MRVGTNLTQSRSFRTAASVLLALSVCLAGHRSSAPRTTSAIVQSTSLAQASALVRGVGGTVTHELGIIDAVAANPTPSQLSTIKGQPGVRLYGDRDVKVAGGANPNSWYPTLIGANRLHQQGIRGKGVTVAIIDTGWWYSWNWEKWDTSGKSRILAEYNAIKDKMAHLTDTYG